MHRSFIMSAGSIMAMAAFAAPKGTGSAPPPPPAPAAPSASKSGYTFAALPLPVSKGVGGRKAGEDNKLALALAEVPLDRSFLEAVTVPDTITDPDERDKEFKALARRLTNKLGGTIRRYRKIAGNELHNFALRTVNDPGDEAEGHLGVGVRVWRVEDSKPEDKTPSTPPAPPAPPAPQA